MPAVLIRQLENMQKLMMVVSTPEQREIVQHHAQLVLRSSEDSVAEEVDRNDVRAAYDGLILLTRDMWEG